ncbi:TetR/AcrR family transcriptional regulator [Staphylococcus chromogenes]|nr:TetR/AcrR family transcriptional regulator [Staphylococcus chromogenes]
MPNEHLVSTPRRTRLTPEARKQAILDAAQAHFSAQPFPAVSVSAIAEDTGVSVALVHKYFQSKNGLFATVLRTWLLSIEYRQDQQVAALAEGAAKQDQVTAFLHGYLHGLAQLPSDTARHHVVHGHDDADANRLRAEFRQRGVEKLQAIVQPNDSSHDAYALTAALGALRAVAGKWAERGCPEQDFHTCTGVLIDGLRGSLGDWQR